MPVEEFDVLVWVVIDDTVDDDVVVVVETQAKQRLKASS